MGKKEEITSKNKKTLTRRDFLRSASLAATAAVSLPATFGPFSILTKTAKAQSIDQIKVVVARDTATHQGSTILPDYTKILMDEAIRRYSAVFDVGEAYKSVLPRITTDSVIGIKVNCIYPDLSTHPEVVDALVNGLQQMRFDGEFFPANNIIIWDRTNADLQNAGYTINTGSEGVRCFGTDQVGFDYSVSLDCAGEVQHPSLILTEHIDYHIDFSVFKNAGGAGLTMSLKNNYGCIDAPWNMHGSNCDPYIAALNQQMRDVLDVQESLFIVDALFGCYFGGPMTPPNMEYNGIILGMDRVAVDSIGRSILEEYGCTSLANSIHVDTAASAPYNLGTNDLDEIHRVDIDSPSIPVSNLQVKTTDRDTLLSWSTPEYTGQFKILRSADPAFSNFDEIAITNATQFIDPNIIGPTRKNFYRVLKTW